MVIRLTISFSLSSNTELIIWRSSHKFRMSPTNHSDILICLHTIDRYSGWWVSNQNSVDKGEHIERSISVQSISVTNTNDAPSPIVSLFLILPCRFEPWFDLGPIKTKLSAKWMLHASQQVNIQHWRYLSITEKRNWPFELFNLETPD